MKTDSQNRQLRRVGLTNSVDPMAVAMLGIGGTAASLAALYLCTRRRDTLDDVDIGDVKKVATQDALMEILESDGKAVVYLTADW